MDISSETVPMYLAMLVVVPLTYDAIKVVLEDKLDFDVIINRNMLRFLEAVIAIMIFPSAAVFSICVAVFFVMKTCYKIACIVMEFLSEPAFFSMVGYYISFAGVFLSLQLWVMLMAKFIYKSL